MPTMLDTRALRDELATKDNEARAAYAKATQTKEALAAAGLDALRNPKSPEFEAANAAKKAHSAIAQECEVLRAQINDAIGIESFSAATAAEPTADQKRDIRNFSQFIAQRICDGAQYREITALLAASQSAPIGTRNLGQALDRGQVREMLQTGRISNLVTGASDTSAGAWIYPDYKPMVELPQRPPSIIDMVFIGETNSDTIQYPRQTAYPTSAAFTAEPTATNNGDLPQGSFTWEIVSDPVKPVGELIPVTRIALSDAAMLSSYIERGLLYDHRKVLEDELISADGTGNHLTGLDHISGTLSYTQGTSDAAELPADAVHRGITSVEIADYQATAVAMHPSTWETIRLAKDDDGNYLLGPIAASGQKVLWGLPVVTNRAFATGKAYVGDLRQFELWIREGANILVSDSHSDWFGKVGGIIAMKCEGRYGFSAPRPTALCVVTFS